MSFLEKHFFLTEKGRDRVASAAVALLTFFVFSPALMNGFVNWDDDINFLNNPHYRGLGLSQLKWMWTTYTIGHYSPLTWMSRGLDYLVWGMRPVGYHLTNLLLHAANAVLFYRLARRLFRVAGSAFSERSVRLTAAVSALFFAVHPLRVETVVWATERGGLLSGTFYLACLVFYLRWIESGGGNLRNRNAVWAEVFFALALLSKTSVMALPAVLLLMDVYPLRRLGGERGWFFHPSARRVWMEKIPFLLLALLSLPIAFLGPLRAGAMKGLGQYGLGSRLALVCDGLIFYLQKTFWPVGLSPLYELPSTVRLWSAPHLTHVFLVVLITALVLAIYKRWPFYAVAWGAYGVVLLPVSRVFLAGPQWAADRYTYVSCLPWALLAGAGLVLFLPKKISPALGRGLIVCVFGVLSFLTWRQTRVWRDSETLWRHALSINPRTSLAHINLGIYLHNRGRAEEAAVHYQAALDIDPHSELARANIGNIRMAEGKYSEAMEHYRAALALSPANPGLLNNVGVLLFKAGRSEEAMVWYQKALQIAPNVASTYVNLGNWHFQKRDFPKAIENYETALRLETRLRAGTPEPPLDPSAREMNPLGAIRGPLSLAQIHMRLAEALYQGERYAEAAENYRRALVYFPNDSPAMTGLADSCLALGRWEEAASLYEALLRNSDSAEFRYNYGLVLLNMGKPEEALRNWQQALVLEPADADAHVQIGLVLAARNDLSGAERHYEKALEIKPDSPEAHYNLALILLRQGRETVAQKHLQRVVGLRPRFGPVWKLLGELYLKQGDASRAQVCFRKAKSLGVADEESR
ncbi:MAG TPA: tetratricopeptide repeat protein [Elusimicrobiota bacterium]|nr:tetratricopeptide repeat protein [Elusimicrobiota bacterium]